MTITIRWETTYAYESPVRAVHMELRVLPQAGPGQNVLSSSLHADPESPVGVGTDAFGNTVHRVGFLGSVQQIKLAAEAQVEIAEGRQAQHEPLSPLHRHLALQETARSPFDPRIAEMAHAAGDARDGLMYALRLMEQMAGRYRYEVGKTDVGHTALDFIDLGAGVCQDFAHLMIAALRVRGLPAFYVSGYLAPQEGEEALSASHAWVRAYLDGAWYGFDPANHQRQDERYVVVAVGRDYDDVPPVKGSVRGMSEEEFATVLRIRSEQPQ